MTKEQQDRLVELIGICKSESARADDLRSDVLAARRFVRDSAEMAGHAVARLNRAEQSINACLQAWTLYRDEFEVILSSNLRPKSE